MVVDESMASSSCFAAFVEHSDEISIAHEESIKLTLRKQTFGGLKKIPIRTMQYETSFLGG